MLRKVYKAREKWRVLKWINDYRFYEQEREPLKRIPKGKQGSPCNCPIGKATGLLVDGTHLVDPTAPNYTKGIIYDLPPHIRKFTDDFDEGKYPELELNG